MRINRDVWLPHREKLIFAVLVLLLVCMFPPAAGGEEGVADKTVVSGVVFENTIERSGQRFEIIGAGLMRYMIIMRGYAAALYLGAGHSKEELFDDIPKWLEIEYYHNIPAQAFIRATQHGLEANLDEDELKRLKPRIDSLYACYRDIKKHARYSFVFIPDSGSQLLLDGEVLCTFDGLDSADALFSIWLGKNPLDKKLKKNLLGQD